MLADYIPPGHSRVISHNFEYRWHTMPLGVKRVTFSKIDALLEIVALETGLKRRVRASQAIRYNVEGISRMRAENRISTGILLNATVFAGLDYLELCKVFDVEPVVYPHRKALK